MSQNNTTSSLEKAYPYAFLKVQTYNENHFYILTYGSMKTLFKNVKKQDKSVFNGKSGKFVIKDPSSNHFNIYNKQYGAVQEIFPASDVLITEKFEAQMVKNKEEQQQAFWTSEECIYVFNSSPEQVFSDHLYYFMFNVAITFATIDIFVKNNLGAINTRVPSLASNLATMEYMESVHQDAYNKLSRSLLNQYDKYNYNDEDTTWNMFLDFIDDLSMLQINLYPKQYDDPVVIDFLSSDIPLFPRAHFNPKSILAFYQLLQDISFFPCSFRFVLSTLIEVQLLTTFTIISAISQSSHNDAIQPLVEINELVNIDETIHVNNASYIIKELILDPMDDEEDRKEFIEKVVDVSRQIIKVFVDLFANSITNYQIYGIRTGELKNLYYHNTAKFLMNLFNLTEIDIDFHEPPTNLTIVHELQKKHNFFERKGIYSEQGFVDLASHLI